MLPSHQLFHGRPIIRVAALASCSLLVSLTLFQSSIWAQSAGGPRKPLPPSPVQIKVPSPSVGSGFILADNTPVKLKFKETITSKTAQENQPIEFEVSEDVTLNNVVVITKGATAKGIISEVKRAHMLGRKGKLTILLKEVTLATGERVSVRANQSQGGGLSASTIALSAVLTPVFLLMGGKEAKYTAGTEFTAFIDGDFALERYKFVNRR